MTFIIFHCYNHTIIHRSFTGAIGPMHNITNVKLLETDDMENSKFPNYEKTMQPIVRIKTGCSLRDGPRLDGTFVSSI